MSCLGCLRKRFIAFVLDINLLTRYLKPPYLQRGSGTVSGFGTNSFQSDIFFVIFKSRQFFHSQIRLASRFSFNVLKTELLTN